MASSAQLDAYRNNFKRYKQEEEKERENAKRQREAQQTKRMIMWLVVEAGTPKTFYPFTPYEMSPVIYVHSVSGVSATGKRYFKKVFCPQQFNKPCKLCDSRKNWNDLSESERSASFKGKSLVLLGLDPSVIGEVNKWTNSEGKDIENPVTPIRYLHRTPGTADANFFELENMEALSDYTLNQMAIQIAKLSVTNAKGKETTEYKLQAIPKSYGKVKLPPGISAEHKQIIDQIQAAVKAGDMVTLFNFALKTLDLPDEFAEYPDCSEHIFLKESFGDSNGDDDWGGEDSWSGETEEDDFGDEFS